MGGQDYSSWSKEELISEINKLSERTKLGLVWEDRGEKNAEELSGKITLFEEIKSKSLHPDKNAKFNFLIEGDNLQSLTCLNYTHAEKIDVIYIDPPYNTGNNDFKYNDSFVLVEDTFRHSSWLSFMSKRLWLAKDLLKRSGIIIISIDDNEQAHLKLLCDEVFGENNFVACIPTIMNLKGNQDQYGFAGTHEYTLIYAKDKSMAEFHNLYLDQDDVESEWEEDSIGWWKKGAGLKMTGINAPRAKQPSLFFPVWVKPDGSQISIEEQSKWHKVLPITDGNEMSWRWSKEKFKRDADDIIILGTPPNWTFYKKQRPELGDMPSKKPKSVFYRPEYSTTNGTNQVKAIFGEKVFDYPKPIDLIIDLLSITTSKDSVILDFFAGSGTTGHAVAVLNKNDGGQRRFILCTNNEEQIAEKITYQRIKAVGKEISAIPKISGLLINLKYFKCKLASRAKSDSNKKLIARQINTILQFREDCFEELTIKPEFSIYKNDTNILGILLEEESVNVFLNEIRKTKIVTGKIYAFSYGDDDFSDYFEELGNSIKVVPIPISLLNAYRQAYAKGGIK